MTGAALVIFDDLDDARFDTPEELATELAPHLARDEWEMLGEVGIQIKDHISDRGAERVYAALLADCSDTSSANILQFLARQLQSGDQPPKIVRLLTRQVLDHLFSGDTNDRTRYLPLSTLLARCARCRSSVGEEIMTRPSTCQDSGRYSTTGRTARSTSPNAQPAKPQLGG